MKKLTRVLVPIFVIATIALGFSAALPSFAAACPPGGCPKVTPPPVPGPGGINTPPNSGVEFCNTTFAANLPINVYYDGWSVFGTAGVDPYVPHKVGVGLGTTPIYDRPLVLQLDRTKLVVMLYVTAAGQLDWKLVSGQASHCPPPR